MGTAPAGGLLFADPPEQPLGSPAGRPLPPADRPLTILHVTAPAEVGGLERVVQGLAIGHRRRGHRVCVAAVVSPGTEQHPFTGPLRAAGVEVELLPLPPRAYLRERRLLAALLRRLRPDVVHTHGYRPDLLHGGVARGMGVPTVTTLHGSSRMGGLSHLYEWLQERLVRRFDAVVAVSQPLGDRLRALGTRAERLHVVPNAWSATTTPLGREEARRELGLGPYEVVIGFVGRLIRAKGADLFLEALRHLDDLPWRAVIVGDGAERQALEARTDALGLRGRVRFRGARDEAGRLFAAFDVYALSSRTEGTPIVLFEALAARTPVVAAAVGGVPDVVSPAEALLVPPHDPAALAAGIRAALTDPAAAEQRATRAFARLADHFGAERWLARHEAIYRGIQRPSPASG